MNRINKVFATTLALYILLAVGCDSQLSEKAKPKKDPSSTVDLNRQLAKGSNPLSSDQQKVRDRYGWPNSFTLFLAESDWENKPNRTRLETWNYLGLETSFHFENGAFTGIDSHS